MFEQIADFFTRPQKLIEIDGRYYMPLGAGWLNVRTGLPAPQIRREYFEYIYQEYEKKENGVWKKVGKKIGALKEMRE